MKADIDPWNDRNGPKFWLDNDRAKGIEADWRFYYSFCILIRSYGRRLVAGRT